MSKPAARFLDAHICPLVNPGVVPIPHAGGTINMGAPTVFSQGMMQSRVMDAAVCIGPPNAIALGSPTVLVCGLSAARMGDLTMHGGTIVTGAPTVLIGDAGAGGSGGGGPAGDPGVLDSFHTQEQERSCVIATCRNMIQYHTGRDIPESQLREEMRRIMGDPDHDFETQGINPIHAQTLLRNHGVESTVYRNQSVDDLDRLTRDGDPVMVGFRNPGHRVAVSGVETNPDGSRTVTVMDPASSYGGTPRQMSEEEFNGRYNPDAIVIDPH